VTLPDAIGAVVGFLFVVIGVALVASAGWACVTAGTLLLAFALAPRRTERKET